MSTQAPPMTEAEPRTGIQAPAPTSPHGVVPAAVRRNHWMNQVATHAANRPGDLAFRYLGRDTSWGQVHEHVTRLAAALERRGVEAGDRVLLLTLNSPEPLRLSTWAAASRMRSRVRADFVGAADAAALADPSPSARTRSMVSNLS